MNITQRSNDPIFVLGIMPRSGTNFLSDLLCLHPHCGQPSIVKESYFVAHADLLDNFVESVLCSWHRSWGVNQNPKESLLCKSLGDGLVAFLQGQIEEPRLVEKTPSVRNLPLFTRFFPNCRLLVLIRDGRAVTESAAVSFGINREWIMRRWAQAAAAICDYQNKPASHAGQFMIVRYEDLFSNRREELGKIFEFLDLDPHSYDFETADNLPVKGSSETVLTEGKLHWRPVKSGVGFNPIQRWRSWGHNLNQRFLWVAGEEMEALGYEIEGLGRQGFWFTLKNRLLDLWWLASSPARILLEIIRTRRRGKRSRPHTHDTRT